MEAAANLRQDNHAGALLFAYDCDHAFDRLHDALFRARRLDGPGFRPHRYALSILWNIIRMVGRGADRFRYIVECAIRQPAKNLGRTSRSVSDVDGGGEQLRWRNGQND